MGIQESGELVAEPNDVPLEEPKLRSEVVNVGEHRIFYLTADPAISKHHCLVVLLHDQVNDAYIWSESKTIESLAQNGYSVVAVDLPSCGRSSGPVLVTAAERCAFIQDFLAAISSRQQCFVLMAASMAGQYAIPFLSQRPRCPSLIGFVGIAPSEADQLHSTAGIPPTLIVRGEFDTSIGMNAVAAFTKFPNSRQFVVSGGKHLCHVSHPLEVNRVLIEFLQTLKYAAN